MRKALTVAVLLVAGIAIVSLVVGEVLSAPARTKIGPPPAELDAETISLADSQGRTIAGWFARGTPGHGAILLLHGVRSNRRQMTRRAIYLHDLGYSVLLVDLQAHGESDGERISFGYREADGVKAALQFLRTSNAADSIGVIGVSLGAASFVLSDAKPQLSAVVLESMYPTIDEAVADRLRLRLGPIGPLLAPLLTTQLQLRLGLSDTQLRPIDHISLVGAPVLIISGTEDRHTTVAEAKRLFDAAREPKELWLIDGAAHVDFFNFARNAYEKRIAQFLHKYLTVNGYANVGR